MIQILLLIIKIIGIALLVVLGVILLLLALVLFVPICYKAKVIHNPEKTHIQAKVSWMFPVVWVTFQYLVQFSYKIRVFGYAVLDSTKPKKEKKAKPVKQKKAGRKKPEKQEPSAEISIVEQPINSVEIESPIEEKIHETGSVDKKEEPEKEEKKPEKKVKKAKEPKPKKEKKSLGDLIERIKHLIRQKDEVLRILDKPESKHAISYAWNKLKHLLKHILPRKIRGYVAYGSSDPSTTGKVLGIVSMIYAKTGMLVEIKPNFEEEQLECDLEIRGRIQIFTLLLIAAKVFFNKELRGLIEDFKNIKNIA